MVTETELENSFPQPQFQIKDFNTRFRLNRNRYGGGTSSQPAFTCSKLTIETLEQGVKYVQS